MKSRFSETWKETIFFSGLFQVPDLARRSAAQQRKPGKVPEIK